MKRSYKEKAGGLRMACTAADDLRRQPACVRRFDTLKGKHTVTSYKILRQMDAIQKVKSITSLSFPTPALPNSSPLLSVYL